MCQNLTKILSVYLQEPLAHFLSSCYLFIVYFWSFWVFVAVCRAFSSCGEWELLFFIAVHGLLIVGASLVAEHGL